jgi:uncharacterized membrane protein
MDEQKNGHQSAEKLKSESLEVTPSQQVFESLPPDVQTALSDLPEESIEVISTVLSYSGPVPPPWVVHSWEHILPGAAHRLLLMAEEVNSAIVEGRRDARHRNDRFRLFALCLGALLILSLFGCAMGALILGYPYVSVAFLGAALASVFIAYFKMASNLSSQTDQPSEDD